MIPGKDGHLPIPACEDDGGPTELGRLLEEALRCLESTDLYGANAAVKRAHAEAASPASRRRGITKQGRNPRIGGEGMGYLLRRAVLAAAPFLWRKYKQRGQKR